MDGLMAAGQSNGEAASEASPGGVGGIVTTSGGSLRFRLQEKLSGKKQIYPKLGSSLSQGFLFSFPACASQGLLCAMAPLFLHPPQCWHSPVTLVPVQVDLADLLMSLGGAATLWPLSFSFCIMTVSTFSPNTLDLPRRRGDTAEPCHRGLWHRGGLHSSADTSATAPDRLEAP